MNPKSPKRVVKLTIVGTVLVTGCQTLGRVDGPGDDGKDHGLVR